MHAQATVIVSLVADATDGIPAHSVATYLRTARSAAVAGLVFSVVLVVVLILYRTAFPIHDLVETQAPLTHEQIDRARWALYLLPFAGIGFIWFMAALNYSIGHADHRLFTTVYIASGVIFVALMFVAGAVSSAEVVAWTAGDDLQQPARLLPAAIVNALLADYSARMAAIFCLSVSTFGRMRKILPSWLTILGTVTGLFLLLVPFGLRYVEYVFPAWVAILSLYLFIKDPAGQRAADSSDIR